MKSDLIVIGLTGGIASGKSTVLQEFKKRGVETLDCDKIAREVVRVGQPAFKLIVKKFGRGVLKEDGSLDRLKIGEIVFKDPEKRKKLEEIIHPRVFEVISRRIVSAKPGLLMVDVPLLFETQSQRIFEKTIIVWVPLKVQCARLMQRDQLKMEEALNRIQSQWPLDEKRALADFIIDNSKSLKETREEVSRLYDQLVLG